MGSCRAYFNRTIRAEISGVKVWRIPRSQRKLLLKVRAARYVPKGKAWAERTFDTYPSAYADLAASKYCKDPNYAKKSKGSKRKGK